ncbi:MAG: multicopper oxidase domain-containing protein, partial [Victivallales bacterium]
MNRREFIKNSLGCMATVVVGSMVPGFRVDASTSSVKTLTIHITDALKDMVTHNAINTAQCHFWIYKVTADSIDIPAECPGPTIVTTAGDLITLTIINDLDEHHSFFIPGMFNSGSIAPGATITRSFTAKTCGAHLYYDNLNEPVNRVMGLHGALIVMPKVKPAGHRFTPYDKPQANVQKLFDDFGSSEHFPGLAWEEGDSTPWSLNPAVVNCPPFRQYVWLTHQASPNLFAEVANLPAGQIYGAQAFMDAFLRDPFSPTRANRIPQYFTINGQSGFFAHFNPTITPMGRVGEPVVVHILNAGLWTHSMHLHANHFYVTSVNGEVQEDPIWLDVFDVHPMDRVDYTIPFMRPPDLGTPRAIALPETPLTALSGAPVYPPIEEFNVFMPPLGTKAQDIDGNDVELGQRMSPMCYPMHDHSEPSQTAQGGNYNMGLNDH